MKWFTDLQVRTKLTLGFSVMIVFMGIIGALGYFSINRISRNLDEIFKIRLRSVKHIIQTDRNLVQALAAERSMIITMNTPDIFAKFMRLYEKSLQQSDAHWKLYENLPSSERERMLTSQYQEAKHQWGRVSREVVERLDSSTLGRRRATNLSLGLAEVRFDELHQILDQLTRVNIRNAAEAYRSANVTYQAVVTNLLIIAGLALICAMSLAFFIGQGISRPLRNAVDISNKVAQGDLDQEIDVESRDETGQLLAAMRHMTQKVRDVLDEIHGLIQAVQDGRLSIRGNTTAFDGGWRDLVMGVNSVIDAFVIPINMTAESLDRLSRGDIPDMSVEEYRGDFNRINRNLNMLIDATAAVTKIAENVAQGESVKDLGERSPH